MALEGKLSDMPMHDLLRVFQRSTRSGKLVLWNKAELGLLWLLDGQVVNALVLTKPDRRPLHSGEHAVFHLFGWPDGLFRYSPDPERGSYPITIERPTGKLIGEALKHRASDPISTAWGELTLQTPLRVLPQIADNDEQIPLNSEQWTVLVRIGQGSNAMQVAMQTEMDPQQVLMIVANLIDYGLVMPALLADLPQRRLTVEPPLPSVEAQESTPITNLTRAIRRRLKQIAVGA